ncbi:AAA family ATPase [Rhizophagus clarus]|uniref:AAA family ATPase n=1 Tax=Rhizophagus clarus TaxID=94130 RepID=A0A8H3LCQ6_9GLOM|nr:AAA family ATPase [Rhizophagus clarus]
MRKLILSFYSYFPFSYPFSQFYSSSSKPFKISLSESFDILRQKDSYYLDKTHFIPKIESLNASAILSLHPPYFGKTLFLSTLPSYYDIKNKE